MNGLQHAVVRQLAFSPHEQGGKVFLCLNEASKLTSKKADTISDSSVSLSQTCHLKLAACHSECP